MKEGLVCEEVRFAYGSRWSTEDLLLHSDRGSQYARYDYRTLAVDVGMQMSMSRQVNA